MARISKRKYPFLFDCLERQLPFEGYRHDDDHRTSELVLKIQSITKRSWTESKNIIYASQNFIHDAALNLEKLKGYAINKGIYHVLQAGGHHCIVDVQSFHFAEIITFEGKSVIGGCNFEYDKWKMTNEIKNIEFADNYWTLKAISPIAVLLFKQYATLKTKTLPPKGKIKEFHCNYKNDTQVPIDLCDINWYTRSQHDHPIVVRGHWKAQACGKGFKDRKLIYIDPYTKNKYHKGPYKLNNN